MMKKTLIATAAAGLIAVGALVGTTSTASAAVYLFGSPSLGVGIGGPGYRLHRPHQECGPVFKTVRWWDKRGRLHFKQVVVQECHWTNGPGWGGPGPR